MVITGQVPRKMIGTDAFQEIDTVASRACTKHNYLVRNVDELAEVVQEAFYIARTGGPGPVVIDIPKDVTAEVAPLGDDRAVHLPGYLPNLRAETRIRSSKLSIGIINCPSEPVLYVGGGVIHANGSVELLELAETLQIPVTPTLMGLGCSHPAIPVSWECSACTGRPGPTWRSRKRI